MTKEVKLLNSDDIILVDDFNYEELNKFEWFADKDGYAKRNRLPSEDANVWSKQVYMHRQILKLFYGDKRQVDHIDQNKQNNQENNLRICTSAENMRNKKKISGDFTSKYKGVLWSHEDKIWRSYIMLDGRFYSLGYFKDEKTAAKAYDQAARHFHREFACLNFPDEPIEEIISIDKAINPKNYTTSVYHGVYWSTRENMWMTKIKIDGREISAGRYKNEVDGGRMRDKYILTKLDSNKYQLNFPDDVEVTLNWVPDKRQKYSQYIGVTFNKQKDFWQSSVRTLNGTKTFRDFKNEYDAAIEREKYILKNNLASNRIKLNFPDKINEFMKDLAIE